MSTLGHFIAREDEQRKNNCTVPGKTPETPENISQHSRQKYITSQGNSSIPKFANTCLSTTIVPPPKP